MLSFKNTYSEIMRGLTAKVTSGLLPLPEVSLQALEDEVTVESVLQGKIAAGIVMLLKTY